VGAVVDDTVQVIVATGVTADPVDTRSLPGLVEQVTRNTGRSPHRLLADAGYCSDDNLAHLGGAGIEAYVAVARDHHGREAPAALRGRIPARLSARERMSRKLRTKEGRRHYARRKATVEPVFGQIKEARDFRRDFRRRSRRSVLERHRTVQPSTMPSTRRRWLSLPSRLRLPTQPLLAGQVPRCGVTARHRRAG
jgi:hypothetical protein